MQLPNNIREDLQELARLIGSLTDAHSVALFLPTDFISGTAAEARVTSSARPDLRNAIPLKQVIQPGIDLKSGSIDLVAVHSYSKLVRDCRIQVGSGLLGWVADQARPIHLTPCDVGSPAIGIYVDSQPIRSLVAVPVIINQSNGQSESSPCGVLMCDSLKPDGFTNAHVKILEQMAAHIQRLLRITVQLLNSSQAETSWDLFKQKSRELGEAIGHESIEILRIRIETLHELETKAGISPTVQISEQFLRLAQQALPPHFPIIRLPNGDMVVALDNMMSGFFQQKLQSLAQHLHTTDKPLAISIESYRSALTLGGQCNIDATLQQEPISRKLSSNLGGVRA